MGVQKYIEAKLKRRSFKVRFFTASCITEKNNKKLIELLRKVDATPGLPPARLMYQLRGLEIDEVKKEARGYFARFSDDAMVVSSATTPQEEIVELEDGKSYIAKNAFILYFDDPKHEVIQYQTRLDGGHISAFAKYLTEINGNEFAVSFDDVLTPDAMQQLKDGVIKAVEFRIAKPTAKRYAPDPEDTWTNDAMQFMSAAGATTFAGKISTRKAGVGLAVKEAVGRLFKSPQTRSLKVKLSDHDEPIDLFAERIAGKIEISEGKDGTPPVGVYSAMRKEKVRLQDQLDAYFGLGNEALE